MAKRRRILRTGICNSHCSSASRRPEATARRIRCCYCNAALHTVLHKYTSAMWSNRISKCVITQRLMLQSSFSFISHLIFQFVSPILITKLLSPAFQCECCSLSVNANFSLHFFLIQRTVSSSFSLPLLPNVLRYDQARGSSCGPLLVFG